MAALLPYKSYIAVWQGAFKPKCTTNGIRNLYTGKFMSTVLIHSELILRMAKFRLGKNSNSFMNYPDAVIIQGKSKTKTKLFFQYAWVEITQGWAFPDIHYTCVALSEVLITLLLYLVRAAVLKLANETRIIQNDFLDYLI